MNVYTVPILALLTNQRLRYAVSILTVPLQFDNDISVSRPCILLNDIYVYEYKAIDFRTSGACMIVKIGYKSMFGVELDLSCRALFGNELVGSLKNA